MPYNKKFLLIFSIGFLLVGLGSKWTTIKHYGSDIPYMDQWDGEGTSVILPWIEGQFDFLEIFWKPHNEHRIGWTRMWALCWVMMNEQWDPLLVTTLNSFIHILVGLTLIFILRKFLSDSFKWVVLIILVLVFSLPISWENTLQAFQIQVYFSLGCALISLSTLSTCKFWSLASLWGIIMAFAGIPCLSAAFAPPATILFVRNLNAYRARKWDKNDILITIICLVVFLISVLSIQPKPGHEPLHAQSFLQFAEFFIKVCSIPFHNANLLLRPLIAIFIQIPFLVFIFYLFKRKDKIWEKHETTLFALGIWLFLQALAISYSRGNSDIGIRHMDTFSLFIALNAYSLVFIRKIKKAIWKNQINTFCVTWVSLVIIGILSFSNHQINQTLVNHPHKWQKMKEHIRTYLLDNNSTRFKQIKLNELPFINHTFMLDLLNNESIKEILPVGLRNPLILEEEINCGFVNQTNKQFLINKDLGRKFYSSHAKNCYWESKVYKTESFLPILKIKFAGHQDLNVSAIRIESEGIKYPLRIEKFHGNSWQTAHLFIPQKSKSFKFVVECKESHKWIAFQYPIEIGLGSWVSHQIRKYGINMILIGFIFILISIYFNQIYSLKDLIPKKVFHSSFNIILFNFFIVFITSYIIIYCIKPNNYYDNSLWSFATVFILFYINFIFYSINIKKFCDCIFTIYVLSLLILFFFIYIGFWLTLLNKDIGIIYFSFLLVLPVLLSCITFTKSKVLELGINFHAPTLIILVTGIFYISIFYTNRSSNNIETTAASFWYQLPIDNAIPRLFADKIYNGQDPRDFLETLEWKSSDRPPLQTSFILFFKSIIPFLPFDNITFSYIPGILFNLLWIPAIWFFLEAFLSKERLRFLILCILISTPFIVINSMYTWPKLGGAAFVIFGSLALFKKELPCHKEYFIAFAFFCLAWLSHGGTAITIIPLILVTIILSKTPSVKTFVYIILLFIVYVLPWILYQKLYDPPGNRLIKWHLAGIINVDERGIFESLYFSYANISLIDIIHRLYSNFIMLIGSTTKCFNLFNSIQENRACDFYYFARITLIPIIFLIILMIKELKFLNFWNEFIRYKYFLIILFTSIIFWCFIMFIPGSTLNHHGSYANNIIILLIILSVIKNLKSSFLYLILLSNLIYLYINYIN